MSKRKISKRTARRPASKLKISRRQVKSGGMTVQEAGRLGGLIGGRKGGLTVKRERGVEFYQEIGRMGGERVRALIAAGRKATLQRRRVRRQHR
jgi:general stress protein YciG